MRRIEAFYAPLRNVRNGSMCDFDSWPRGGLSRRKAAIQAFRFLATFAGAAFRFAPRPFAFACADLTAE